MLYPRIKLNRWFEGDNDGSDGDDPPSETPPTPTPTPTPTETKVFTQNQVNAFLAEEKRKTQKQNEKIVKQLEDLKKNQSLTEEEKTKLEDRIETIKNEFLTKEELSKKEALKERSKQKSELEAKEKEAAKWRKLYEETTTETGILKAASSDSDVYSQEQILELLLPRTKLVEEFDENNTSTGRFVPKVRLITEDKDGKNIILELTPSDAIKQMKEMKKYENLFINKATGGVGGNNAANGSRRNSNEPPLNDAAEYRKWRKTHSM